MSIFASARQQWLASPRRDLLAGTVVALALIPEAIAFSIIAGVDPAVGLYASFVIAVTIAFVGGRPAMISAATGAMALVMVTLVRDHGLEYLFAASLLCGLIQIVVGLAKLGRYIKFVSRSVMTGFVNSLAILIFLAQMPELIGANWQTFALVGAALVIIYGFPRLTRAVPAPCRPRWSPSSSSAPSSSGAVSTSAPSATWARCPRPCRSSRSRPCP